MNKQSIIIYNHGELELNISVDAETIWLRQNEIAILFDKERTVITRHINKILKENEVDEKSNVQKMHIANSDKPVKFYSLDIVLAVGYRTNSKKAIEFRKWATSVLKQYIYNGYTINSEKITVDRFISLENEVVDLRQNINKINDLVTSNQIKPTQGIFYNGQIFDAYIFVNDILKSSQKEVILIDNFIDDTILTLFSKYPNVKFTIITQKIPKQLNLDIDKYNSQYKNLVVKTSTKYHDRFLLIDNKEAYHIGASLKDLGNRVFAFNKIDIQIVKSIEEIS